MAEFVYVFNGSKQTELIISRLEQDGYYSLLKEIILLFANTHHRINATILLRFVPKMLHVSGELLNCYVLWSCMV